MLYDPQTPRPSVEPEAKQLPDLIADRLQAQFTLFDRAAGTTASTVAIINITRRAIEDYEARKFAPVVDYFQRACDITGVAAAQVRRFQPMDAAAFVRFCLGTTLTPDDVMNNIPPESRPHFAAISRAAQSIGELLSEADPTISKLTTIQQWAIAKGRAE